MRSSPPRLSTQVYVHARRKRHNPPRCDPSVPSQAPPGTGFFFSELPLQSPTIRPDVTCKPATLHSYLRRFRTERPPVPMRKLTALLTLLFVISMFGCGGGSTPAPPIISSIIPPPPPSTTAPDLGADFLLLQMTLDEKLSM